MNQLHIKTIQIFNSILFLDCIYNQIEQRISFHFSLKENNLLLEYNSTNQFLSFYRFNNLSIEDFVLKLLKNTLQDNEITVTEEDIPF